MSVRDDSKNLLDASRDNVQTGRPDWPGPDPLKHGSLKHGIVKPD